MCVCVCVATYGPGPIKSSVVAQLSTNIMLWPGRCTTCHLGNYIISHKTAFVIVRACGLKKTSLCKNGS